MAQDEPVSTWERQLARMRVWAVARRMVDTNGPHPLFLFSLERATLLLAILVALSGIAAALSAAAGLFLFVAPAVWLAWLLLASVAIVLAARRRLQWIGDRFDLISLGIAVLAAASAGLLHHEFFNASSDIGFYVNDATITATTGGRVVDGAHDTLLPGFADAPGGGFRVSAMFGYSSFAALFAYVGGPFLTPLVNVPLSFVTSLAVYLIGRQLGARSGALLGQGFYALSLLTLWFNRWVMTENGATFVFWTATLLVLPMARRWDGARLAALLPVLAFGSLVRAEGIVIALWFLIVALLIGRNMWFPALHVVWTDPARRGKRNRMLGAVAFFLFTLVGLFLALRRSLPLAYLEANFDLAKKIFRGRPVADAPDVNMTGPHPNWGDYALRFEWESVTEYFVHIFLIVAIAGLALRLTPWRRALLIVVLAVPYIAFIMMPPVTTAHPWYMRRLWVALVPMVYILAGVALDVVRAGRRWPLRFKGKDQLRLTPMFVAIVMVAVLFVVQLDVSAPVTLRRENDGVRALLERLEADLPADAVVLVDEDVIHVATLLRLQHGPTVIPWFNQRFVSMEHSLAASDAGGRTYILRLNTTGPTTLLLTDPAAVLSSTEYPQVLQHPVRGEFRSYISLAPLEDGYKPLETYLERAVPPNQWRATRQRVLLEETASPLVLFKNLELPDGGWKRTDRGLEVDGENGTLEINRTKFLPEYLERVQLYAYLTYAQVDLETRYATMVGGTGRRLDTPLHSDGSGTLKQVRIPLPVPMDLDGISLPGGLVLRGALFAIQ